MLKIYAEMIQGSDIWLAARMGTLTASEMKHVVTPGKLQYAKNDKSRAHVNEIAAQRISGYVEPSYVGDDMMRGNFDEIEARILYGKHYAETIECGFITNDAHGFTLGYSPDALIGHTGLIEIKSRKQKYQIETIVSGEVPAEYVLQLQTGLMVSEREWIDFVSYSGGLPMFVKRVYADQVMQSAIISAATAFEEQVCEVIERYQQNSRGMILTERKIFDEEISMDAGDSAALQRFDIDMPGNKERFCFGRVDQSE